MIWLEAENLRGFMLKLFKHLYVDPPNSKYLLLYV